VAVRLVGDCSRSGCRPGNRPKSLPSRCRRDSKAARLTRKTHAQPIERSQANHIAPKDQLRHPAPHQGPDTAPIAGQISPSSPQRSIRTPRAQRPALTEVDHGTPVRGGRIPRHSYISDMTPSTRPPPNPHLHLHLHLHLHRSSSARHYWRQRHEPADRARLSPTAARPPETAARASRPGRLSPAAASMRLRQPCAAAGRSQPGPVRAAWTRARAKARRSERDIRRRSGPVS
jgi:hypothetical protein